MVNSSNFNGLMGATTMIIIMTLFCRDSIATPNVTTLSNDQVRTIPYGQSCGDLYDEECMEGLDCVNDNCGCKDSYLQYFEEQRRCLSHGHCDDVGQCIPHASCHSIESWCICDFGFIKSSENACVLDYNQPCPVEDIWCDNKFSCISGSCKCKSNLQIYNLDKQKCVGLTGQSCTLDDDCVGGTICHKMNETDNICASSSSNKEPRLQANKVLFVCIAILVGFLNN